MGWWKVFKTGFRALGKAKFWDGVGTAVYNTTRVVAHVGKQILDYAAPALQTLAIGAAVIPGLQPFALGLEGAAELGEVLDLTFSAVNTALPAAAQSLKRTNPTPDVAPEGYKRARVVDVQPAPTQLSED
jgi:hypothetical protein